MRLSEEIWDVIDQAVAAYDRHLRDGGEPSLADHLPAESGIGRRAVLIELVKLEQEYRWKSGRPRLIESYIEQWPELADDNATIVELLRAECRTRLYHGDAVSPESLSERFPEVLAEFGVEAVLPQTNVHAEDHMKLDVTAGVLESIRTGQWFEQPRSLPKPLAPETQVGRYTILSVLGRGGMATVYLAQDEELDRVVAIKMLHDRFLDRSAEHSDVLRRDAKAAARLRHPGVVPVYDISVDASGRAFIVMEYVKGESLQRRLERERVSIREALDIAITIADALACAHRAGLIHRDIKPGNILIDENGHARLTDFGLAAKLDEMQEWAQDCSGTLPYMAPEQVLGDPAVQDGRTDVWALGVVLYEMLTGERPFKGSSLAEIGESIMNEEVRPPHELCSTIPRSLSALCMACLERSMDDRVASAEELRDRLVAIRQRTVRNPATRWIVTAVVALSLVIGLSWALWFRNPPPTWTAPADRLHEIATHPFLKDCGLVFVIDTGAEIDLERAYRHARGRPSEAIVGAGFLTYDSHYQTAVARSLKKEGDWIYWEAPLSLTYSESYGKHHSPGLQKIGILGLPEMNLSVRCAMSREGVFQFGTVATAPEEHFLVFGLGNGINNYGTFGTVFLSPELTGPPNDSFTELGPFQNELAYWFAMRYKHLFANNFVKLGPGSELDLHNCPAELRNYLGFPITVVTGALCHQQFDYPMPPEDRFRFKAYNELWSPIAESPRQDPANLSIAAVLEAERDKPSYLCARAHGDHGNRLGFVVEGLSVNADRLLARPSADGPMTFDDETGVCRGSSSNNGTALLQVLNVAPTRILLSAMSTTSQSYATWTYVSGGTVNVKEVVVSPQPKDGRTIKPLTWTIPPTKQAQ